MDGLMLDENIRILREQYLDAKPDLACVKLDWLELLRQQGIDSFSRVGLPTLANEQWRYTNIKPLLNKVSKQELRLSLSANDRPVNATELINNYLSTHAIFDGNSYRVVVVDGSLLSDYSLLPTSGVRIDSLSSRLQNNPESIKPYLGDSSSDLQYGFNALNAAALNQGLIVELDDGVELDKPLEVHVLSLTDHSWVQPRNLYILGEGAKVNFVKHHGSLVDNQKATAYMENAVTQIFLGEGACLEYCLLQNQRAKNHHIESTQVHQLANSEFNVVTVSLNTGWVRNEIEVDLNGEHANCQLNGAYVLSGRQHVDNFTTIRHRQANCHSHEMYKGVLDQRSRSVFHGRIKVDRGANKTDAVQANNTILLSDDAEIDTKPQLEIYADDVKCAHGATIGQLDQEAVFYMRSRGISLSQARALLIYGFVNEVFAKVSNEALKAYLDRQLQQIFIT